MKRLIEKTVFSGLVTAWRFATCPTSRSPSFVNATTDGVIREPFLVHEHGGLPAFHNGHDGVRRSEVNSNDFLAGSSFAMDEVVYGLYEYLSSMLYELYTLIL